MHTMLKRLSHMTAYPILRLVLQQANSLPGVGIVAHIGLGLALSARPARFKLKPYNAK